MRSIEKEAEERDSRKEARLLKRAEQNKQLRMPNEYSVEHEKSLRKIATKGVVALFNAISQSKREAEETGNDKAPLSKTSMGFCILTRNE